jgi:exonuclease III
MNTNCYISSWNVRGLNACAKRESVRQTILSTSATIICLEETKIMSWTKDLLKETVGCKLAKQTIHLPSLGASGGILIACDEDYFDIAPITYTSIYSISARVSFRLEDMVWDLTTVYGPQQENEKIIFLSELCTISNLMRPEWLILGDFNMIRRVTTVKEETFDGHVMSDGPPRQPSDIRLCPTAKGCRRK